MHVQLAAIDKNGWTVDWIPISYLTLITKYQLKRSCEITWSNESTQELFALCRAYYIDKKHVELGDVWLNEDCRGKSNSAGEKYSHAFLREAMNKIKSNYPLIEYMSLIVSASNAAAVKLYQKRGLCPLKKTSTPLTSETGNSWCVNWIADRHEKGLVNYF